MAYATTPTLLSLDRYAAIMGITPLSFNGGASGIIFPSGVSTCADVWYQHSWQHSDQVSREDLARSIASAERDIANILGYLPAASWVENEPIRYPQYNRRDMYGAGMWNVRGQRKAVKLKWGKFIQGGKRQSDLQGVVVPVYSNEDGDTFDETVTVSYTGIDDDAELCEIKVYHVGFVGNPQYEIRPARTATLVGDVYTATFWAWQFFTLGLLEELPISGYGAIDADDEDSYLASVEVRWTYNDYAASHGTIFWENDPVQFIQCAVCAGVGCEACSLTSQDLCIHVRNTNVGLVAVTPAAYSDGAWGAVCPAVGRDPDQVTVNYYGGEQSDRYLAGYTCDPLPHYLAEAIAWMATARLERPYCSCGVITALNRDLRRDMSLVGTSDGTSWFAGEIVNENPFGTRLGEVKAWQRIDRMVESVTMGVAL